MGNKMGPAIAIIFMHQLELQMSSTTVTPDFYVRYIDDICGLWVRGEEVFSRFVNDMNALHPSIKFTTDREDRNGSVAFLDVLITHKEDNSYTTGLFIKDTHSDIALHYMSAHPRQTKLNTLKNELRRAYRLSSDHHSAERSVKKIKDIFQQNGYPSKVIEQANRQVREQSSHSRTSVRVSSPRCHDDAVYLALPFIGDESCRKIEAAVKKSGVPCKLAWVSRGGLKKQLVRTDLRGPKCPISRGRCIPCASGLSGGCGRNNVVYEVRCTLCGACYVGECIRPVRDRFFEHRRAAFRKDIDNPVGHHFKTHHLHDVLPEIPIQGSIQVSQSRRTEAD